MTNRYTEAHQAISDLIVGMHCYYVEEGIDNGLREGQAYYIYLSDAYPELADDVCDAGVCPFYDDDLVTDFCDYLQDRFARV